MVRNVDVVDRLDKCILMGLQMGGKILFLISKGSDDSFKWWCWFWFWFWSGSSRGGNCGGGNGAVGGGGVDSDIVAVMGEKKEEKGCETARKVVM